MLPVGTVRFGSRQPSPTEMTPARLSWLVREAHRLALPADVAEAGRLSLHAGAERSGQQPVDRLVERFASDDLQRDVERARRRAQS